jgi:hypothetical protein
MAEGVDAVKAQLIKDFGAIQIVEGHDPDTQDILLSFEFEGLDYRVRVTHEFDDDYASGQLRLDLSVLSGMLRASNTGWVRVMRTGIISK